MVDIGLGGGVAPAEAEALARLLGGVAHGFEDVAFLHFTAAAGAALADGNAFEIERDDHVFAALAMGEELDDVGGGGAAEADNGEAELEGGGFELCAEVAGGGGFGFQIFQSHLQGGGHAADGGEVFGACAAVTLLAAAGDEGVHGDLGFEHQCADAFGAAEFVASEGEEVGTDVVGLYWEVADGLDGIGVEKGAVGVGEGGDFGYWLKDAVLVIGVHDADEGDIAAFEFGGEDLHIEEAVGIYWNFGGVEGEAGVADAIVLDTADEEAFAGSAGHDAAEGEVVSLGAAGGEGEAFGTQAEEGGGGAAGFVELETGGLAFRMDAAGVAEDVQQLDDACASLWAERGGGGVIEIGAHGGYIGEIGGKCKNSGAGPELMNTIGVGYFTRMYSTRISPGRP